ncbi:MAG TPA: alpha/beta fold hydrolase, partial [Gemmatimonadales bacterium]|nr:alpha/beta fold hydrolase [Gemmatimonadales bacterium]
MSIRLTVYPDECDAYGHLNQASYLALFERARWELLRRGPGMDVFERAGVWPAVRRATIDYHAGVWPGDELIFSTELVSRGRTSFTLRQRAIRDSDALLVATLESVFVCIDNRERPVSLPDSVIAALAAEPRQVELGNGVTIAFDEAGQGDPPAVFLHGYPFDRTMWRAQLEGIKGRRLIAVDLRSFGSSNPSTAAATIDDYADDVAALLDKMGVSRAVVAGLSMGGYVALAFAERHRDRLAALALPERTRLVHAQRAARSGFGLAEASSVDTAISIGNWSLARQPDDHYRTSLADVQLALDLAFTPASAPVLQGEAGFSRKGPLVQQASYYYSRPQLRVSGRIASGSLEAPVAGIAWLDHEWSSEILDRHAEGWDWVGLNFDDGSAL